MYKKMIIIVTMMFFSLGSISISAERDCSNPKGFHNKLMCNKIGHKTTDNSDSEGSKKKFNPFKSLNDLNKKTKKTLF